MLIHNKYMRIGYTILTSYGFRTCAQRASNMGGTVMQIFINSPKSYHQKRSKSDLLALNKDAQERDIPILVHGNYMTNLCNPKGSTIYQNATKVLIKELNDSVLLNAIGVVVHMGKNVPKLNFNEETATRTMVDGLTVCLAQSDSKSVLILETGAGQGTEICTRLEDLGKLRMLIDTQYRDRVKFCLDTCHMFAAGYDIGNVSYVEFLEKRIDSCLGWGNIAAIHLNDSKFPLNCRRDSHADIGRGHIGFEGLMKFVEISLSYNIPIILETPCEEINGVKYTFTDQLKVIQDYLNTKTIPDFVQNSNDKFTNYETIALHNMHPFISGLRLVGDAHFSKQDE